MTGPGPSPDELSLAERLALLPADKRDRVLSKITADEATALRYDWDFWARPKQKAPTGAWRTWLLCAGRGFGKTMCIVQWALQRIERKECRLLHIVTATAADGRDVIVEGDSGFLAKAPPWLLGPDGYEPSKRRLTFRNGARAILFSADEPRQLRGPQCDTAIADELAAWRYPEAWDMLMMGLRLGDDPRVAVATTPRPTPFIKALVKESLQHGATVRVTKGSTFENRSNLAGAFLDNIVKKYSGTRLGRQELDAEILDDAPGALWKLAMLDNNRVPIGFDGQPALPRMRRVVVAVDPSVKAKQDERSRDRASAAAEDGTAAQRGIPETGIVVCGLGEDDHGYVLADRSVVNPTPEQWATAVRQAYYEFSADRIICETNNGGDLVEANVRTVDRSLPVKQVTASRGKQVRAEPVAALDEQGRIHHLGVHPQLEDQMTSWEPGVSTWSPNRVDARVWGFTELMLKDEYYGGTDWDYLDRMRAMMPRCSIDG